MSNTRTEASSIVRLLVPAICVLLLLRLLIPTAYRAAVSSGDGLRAVDSRQYVLAAQRVVAGAPLYDPNIAGYPNPPLLAVVLRPLAPLSESDFYVKWTAINVVCLALAASAIAWCAAASAHALAAGWVGTIAIVAVFRNWPVTLELGLGNCHAPILFAYALAIVAVRQRWWACALFLLLLAGMIKTWAGAPALALLCIAPIRASVVAIAFAAVTMVAQFAIVGFDEIIGFIERQRTYGIQPDLVSNSVPGFFRLLLLENPISTPWVHSPTLHAALSLGVSAAFVIFFATIAWRRRQFLRGRPDLLLVASVSALLVVLPLCHITCLLLHIPTIGLVLAAATRSSSPRRGASLLLIAAGAYFVLSLPLPGINPLVEWATHGAGILVIAIYPILGAALAFAAVASASAAQPLWSNARA